MGSGKALEQLVATIERVTAHNPNVVVESPKKLVDRTDGRLREHDVVLTITQGHHQIAIAIECRDHKRPVTVNQVEGFITKCRDTGIHHGAMVSTSGYSKNARDKALHHEIRCLDMEEAENFPWLLAPGVLQEHTRLLHSHWTFYPAEQGIIESCQFEVIDKNGNPLSKDALQDISLRALKHAPRTGRSTVDPVEVSIRVDVSDLWMRSLSTGDTVPVSYATLRMRYSVTSELKPFNLTHYVDKSGNQSISQTAIAHLNVGKVAGQILLIHREGQGARVVFVRNDNRNSKKRKR